MTAPLLIEDRGRVRVLTLNRPTQLNAMDSDLYTRTIEALEESERDESVLAIVVRGAGTSFCSGADTREFASLTPDQADRVEQRAGLTYALHKTLSELSKPTIAAVQGYAVGGGCGFALACDVAVAAENAKMGHPEIKHGLIAAVVMATTKHVSRKAGLYLVMSGRLLSAKEALAMGMITLVVPDGTEFDEALKVAEDLCKRVPASLQGSKRLYKAVADMPLAEGLELGRKANEAMRGYRAEALKTYAGAVQAAKTSR